MYSTSNNTTRTLTVNKSIGEFRTYAHNKGAGYDILSFYPAMLLQILYLIRYKNLNSQASLGNGNINGTGQVATGTLDKQGLYYGNPNSDTEPMKFMGIENLWGNLRMMIDGLILKTDYTILTAFNNFNDAGDGYIDRGIHEEVSGNTMVRAVGNNELGFIPSKTVLGTGYNRNFCDYARIYSNDENTIPLLFGGSNGTRGQQGIFYSYTGFAVYTSISEFDGARLMYL
jgi:hypothetical protein